jgi:hypothetical protein
MDDKFLRATAEYNSQVNDSPIGGGTCGEQEGSFGEEGPRQWYVWRSMNVSRLG